MNNVNLVYLFIKNYYVYLLKAQYNILNIAGSRLEYKHAKETKNKISISNKGTNHNFYGKIHTY